MKINYIDVLESFDNDPPEIDYVLPGLAAGTVGMVAATGSTGKTNFSLSLGISLAAGLPIAGGVWDAPGVTGRVTVLAAEDPTEILKDRLHSLGAWLKLAGADGDEGIREKISNGFFLASLVGQMPYLIRADGSVDDSAYTAVYEAAKDSRLLIIDTLRRFYGGEENDSGAVTKFLQTLELIAQETGCTIIFTHHAGKSAVLNGQASVAQAARGSSALTDNIRWQANLAGMTQDEAKEFGRSDDDRKRYVRLDITKANYAAQQATRWMIRREGGVLESVTLTAKKQSSKSHLKVVKED